MGEKFKLKGPVLVGGKTVPQTATKKKKLDGIGTNKGK